MRIGKPQRVIEVPEPIPAPRIEPRQVPEREPAAPVRREPVPVKPAR